MKKTKVLKIHYPHASTEMFAPRECQLWLLASGESVFVHLALRELHTQVISCSVLELCYIESSCAIPGGRAMLW